MKAWRTKVQEIINLTFGYGVYTVHPEDIEKVRDFYARVLPEVFAPPQTASIVKYLSGEPLNAAEKQRKFHTVPSLRFAIRSLEVKPDIMEVVLDEEEYSLAAIGKVVYGKHGDPKVYHLRLPDPESGNRYTKAEVENILRELNSNDSD